MPGHPRRILQFAGCFVVFVPSIETVVLGALWTATERKINKERCFDIRILPLLFLRSLVRTILMACRSNGRTAVIGYCARPSFHQINIPIRENKYPNTCVDLLFGKLQNTRNTNRPHPCPLFYGCPPSLINECTWLSFFMYVQTHHTCVAKNIFAGSLKLPFW